MCRHMHIYAHTFATKNTHMFYPHKICCGYVWYSRLIAPAWCSIICAVIQSVIIWQDFTSSSGHLVCVVCACACECACLCLSVCCLIASHDDTTDGCLLNRAEIREFAAWPWVQKVTNDISTKFIQESQYTHTFLSSLIFSPLNSTLAILLSVLATVDFIKCFNLIYRSHLSLMALCFGALHC